MQDATITCGGIEILVNATLRFVDTNTTAVIMSQSFIELEFELIQMIFKRDTLNEGLGEIQIYLAILRWARGYGTLDVHDLRQFDTTEVL